MIRLDVSVPGGCVVCGMRAYYGHAGKLYCAANECQCVAAGLLSIERARLIIDEKAKAYDRAHGAGDALA